MQPMALPSGQEIAKQLIREEFDRTWRRGNYNAEIIPFPNKLANQTPWRRWNIFDDTRDAAIAAREALVKEVAARVREKGSV
jgi:hypothetical protein